MRLLVYTGLCRHGYRLWARYEDTWCIDHRYGQPPGVVEEANIGTFLVICLVDCVLDRPPTAAALLLTCVSTAAS